VQAIGVLVVDGHPVVLQGLRRFTADVARVRILEGAESGERALTLARRLRPDVVLVDPWLPDMLLGEAVTRLRGCAPRARVVLFPSRVTPALADTAATLGVDGILGKDASAEHVLAVIERVAAGEVVTDPFRGEALRRAAEKLHGPPLTPREHEVLRRAARGESNAEIGRAIHLAPTTVKSYLQSALRKLGARNRVDAVVKLSELQLL
jgi:DNA-binding NarL/FixJ family response regulator